MKSLDKQLVSGSIVRSVWKLAWPLVLLNMVNGLHGFIDHVLVGWYVPSEDNAANAGIGVAWQVFLVIVVFLSSLYHGMSVVVARCAGREDRETMNQVAYQTMLLSIYILVFIAAPVGYFVAPHLLVITKAEPHVMAHALPYIRILFILGSPIFLLLILAGGMQASGDPRTPLVLGALATVLNILLSYVFITGAGPLPRLGASGAALATCLAPAISLLIAVVIIARRGTILHLPKRKPLIPEWRVLAPVIRIGIPAGIGGVALNAGGVVVLRYVGMLENSAAAQAIYTICYAQLFALVTWPSWALRNAAATVMSQNIGAGDRERGRQGVYIAVALGAAWALMMGCVYWAFGPQLLALFRATEPAVQTMGVHLLQFLAVSALFLSIAVSLTGGLTGAGDTVTPMIIAFTCQIGVLLGMCQTFVWLDMLTPTAVWSAILTSHVLRFLVTWIVFLRAPWRRVHIDVTPVAEEA